MSKVKNMEPQYAIFYNNRGGALYDLEKIEDVIKDCNEAIKLKPDDAAAYNKRGHALRALGKNAAAIEDYNKVIKLKPDDAAAYNKRGVALHALGKIAKAIEDYNKVIKLKPDYAAAYSNRGGALYALGKFKDAIKDCNKAIKLKPDDAAAYNNRGGALYALGKFEDAIKDCNEAIKLKPDYAVSYNNRDVALYAFNLCEMDLKNTTILAGKQIINDFGNIFWPIRNTRYKETININYRGKYINKIDRDEDKGKKLLEKFKDFYVENIQKGNFCRKELLKIEKVAKDDSRTALQGQDKAVATQDIEVGEILGIYTGILLKDHSKDMRAELDWVLEKFGEGHGLAKLQQYFFDVYPHGKGEPLVLSAYGRGNELMKINAPYTHHPSEQNLIESNVHCVQIDYNKIPFITFYTIKKIKEGEELLFDYGLSYWQAVRKVQELPIAYPEAYARFKESEYYKEEAPNEEYKNFLAFVYKNESELLYEEVKDHGIYIDDEEKNILSEKLDIKDKPVFDLMKSIFSLVARFYKTNTVDMSLLENSLKKSVGDSDFIEFAVYNDGERMKKIEKILQVYDAVNISGDNHVITTDC